MNINTRVFFFVIGRPFYRRLVMPFFLLLFVASLADANTNWTALRAQLAARDPLEITLLFTSLFLFWGIMAGRALRPVWHQPTIAYLVRQPIGRWQWARYLIPSLSIAFLPVVGIWWLAPHYAHSPIHYFGFVGLAWTLILGASFTGSDFSKWTVEGTSVIAALIFGYAHQPAVAYLAALVTIALLPLSVAGIRRQVARSRQVNSGHLASMTPIRAIVRRDLLCLWRLERKSLFGFLLLGALAALMMLALRVNGQVVGREAFVYACGLLWLSVLSAHEMLTGLKTRLGPELMRQRWPISHWHRGAAVLFLMTALTGPSTIALAAVGSTMGPAYEVIFVLYAATTIVGLTAFFSHVLIVATPMLGWSLLLSFVHTVLAIALPPWVYGPVAVALLPLGLVLIVRGLRAFTHHTEIGILE